MEKNIPFQSLSSYPSPYDAPDGALDLSLDLIHEDGALRPVVPPKTLRDLSPYECLSLHRAAGEEWLILYLESGGEVYASPAQGDLAPVLVADGFSSRPDVAVLGNTLAISDGETTAYALYSADVRKYTLLGDSIPEISVSLALSRKHDNFFEYATVAVPEGTTIDSLSSILTAFNRGNRGRDTYGRIGHNTATDMLLDDVENAVYSILNKANTQAAEENTFIHPFLVRWALRLYDGSYIHQSAPVLMIPNSGLPPLMYTPSSEPPFVKFQIKILLRRCAILWKPSGLDALASWKDIVKSIDFFVTPPVYVYDQSGTLHAVHRTASDSTIFSHSGAPSSSAATRAATPDGGNHRHPVTPEETPAVSFPAGNQESVTQPSGSVFKVTVFSREHIEAGITSASAFHLIASVPLSGEDAAQDLEAFAPLDLNDSALSTLTSRPLLTDDWRSHDRIRFSSSRPYNSRLALAGISSSIFQGFPVPDMAQYWQDPDAADVACTVWVKTVRDFRSVWISVSSLLQSGHLPRFLFYPDPNASEMRVICADGSGWILPLKTHDFLNGAYWFDGIAPDRTPKAASVLAPSASGDVPVLSSSDTLPEPSKVFLSEVGNPFLFPVENRISVGSESVMALSSAARALSEGQFGQFPLYAFTAGGVWALEVTATGVVAARQPITRDVCINPRAITQIDSAVLFPTARGIMLLSGSRAEAISDPVADHAPFDISSLPGIGTLHALAGHDADDTCFPAVPFLTFLQGCGILFDYVRQRIILFNPSHTYAYLYSLRSRTWGMVTSRIAYAVPSYPEALAVDLDGKLIDFSQEAQAMRPVILVTRPLKIDSPRALKSIQALRVLGDCPASAVRTVLYASRDLSSWQRVASSATARIVNRSGSPFRFFRIALVAYLDRGSSLSSAAIRFTPRLPSKF